MYEYKCKINEVVDGDTVNIDLDLGFNVVLTNLIIRLNGIDAPESRTTNLEEKARGLLSKKKLSEKLPVNSSQRLQTIQLDNNDDKFGRILAVFLSEDGKSVNQWMIDNNYAVSYQGQNKKIIQEAHQKNKQALIQRGELK